MMPSFFRLFLLVTLTLAALSGARGQVVINEIMYRPGSSFPENTGLEFIELYNPTDEGIDVGGWGLTTGVDFGIPAGTVIPAGGYLVIASNPAQVQSAYGIGGVLGPWLAGATLSNNSEKVTLSQPDAVTGSWVTVNEVNYASEGDWATRIREGTWGGWAWSTPANGGNKSLELRNPLLSNRNGQNWAPAIAGAGATPGAVNSVSTGNVPPIISDVEHFPAVPNSTESVRISCDLTDELPANLGVTLFWRNATPASPGAFQTLPMTDDGSQRFAAVLTPKAHGTIVEFYISATDGVNTRTWPAPTSDGQTQAQNANCQYQVDNEAPNGVDSFYRLVLTTAENNAFENVNSGSDRQFNQTLIVTRGADTTIRYRSSMRIRGASSRGYQFKPLRISVPNDNRFEGITDFNLNPKASHLQYIGMRLFQAAGLPAADAIPVELRRNGAEQTTSGGSTPDFGKWVRMEEFGADAVDNHWPTASDGNAYKKVRPEAFWPSGYSNPSSPDAVLDGWSKQNNSAANDWTDLITFFNKWQANQTGGVFTAAQIADLETVSDLDQWARWFAVMTFLQSNETNISNGADDDYSGYFVPSAGGQRRLQLFPHDLDTIFGLGDSPLASQARGLFDMTEDGSVFYPLLPLFGTSSTPGNAAFRMKYFTALRELFGGAFNADNTSDPNPPLYQFLDSHLSGWVPVGTITAMKTFATQRQAYLLGLIGAPAIAPPAPTSLATLTRTHGSLMIHEVLANNVSAINVSGVFPDVIELRNTSGAAVSVAGMSLTDDPAVKAKYVFPAGTTVPANGYLVIYADTNVGSPRTGFALSSGGETLQLYSTVAAGQTLLDTVTFGPQAGNLSIGRTGGSLGTWALCTPTFGAANAAVGSLAAPSVVRINEWLGNSDYQVEDDFIELYNPAAQPVPIGGMSVTDDFINFPFQRAFPALSFISAGGFLRLDAVGDDANPVDGTELPFKLSSSFGTIALLGQNGAPVDRVEIVAQPADASTGRIPDGSASTTRFGLPTSVPTPGSSNVVAPPGVLALMNGLRITELLYHPANREFIELQNIGSTALDLSGVRFTDGITYTFAAGTTLAPGAFLVVCRDRASFQAQFGNGVPLAPGAFAGTLDNAGEVVAVRPPVPWEAMILNFAYESTWYAEANNGYSLTVGNATTTPAGEWDERPTWFVSPVLYGTPGNDGPPAINSSLTAAGVLGDPFQYQITASKGPLSFGATPLPPGLSFDPGTGIISGTPASSGTFTINLSAANTAGSDAKTLVLTIVSSGPLAGFQWDPIDSAKQVGVPFTASLRAVDAQGRTVASFNGSPALSSFTGGGGSGTMVAITECALGNIDSWEIQNVSGTTVNTAGWFMVMIDGSSPNTIAPTLALPASLAPGEVHFRTEDSNSPNYFGFGLSWISSGPGWTMLVDNFGTIRDFAAWGFSQAQIQTINVNANGFALSPSAQGAWSGVGEVLSGQVVGNQAIVRTGSDDHQNETDWAVGTASLGSQNPGLLPPFPAGSLPVTSTPATLSGFVNGVWTGNVTISQASSAVILRVNDGAGRTANSTPFDVVLPPAPIISGPTSVIAVVNQPFSFPILTTNFATSFTASNLNPGLTVNGTTGVISGTPTGAGTRSVALSATSAGGTSNGTLSIQVQADADGDGMGDAWESANGLNPGNAADANTDLDRDGQSNRAEWLAGTAPNSRNSRLAITGTQIVGANLQVTWSSVPGKRYRVSMSTTLAANSWSSLTPTALAPNAPSTSFMHVGAMNEPRRFYRVEIVP